MIIIPPFQRRRRIGPPIPPLKSSQRRRLHIFPYYRKFPTGNVACARFRLGRKFRDLQTAVESVLAVQTRHLEILATNAALIQQLQSRIISLTTEVTSSSIIASQFILPSHFEPLNARIVTLAEKLLSLAANNTNFEFGRIS